MKKYDESNVYVPFKLDPLANDAVTIGHDFKRYLSYHLGRFQGCAHNYIYEALAYTVRDRLMVDWRNTWNEQLEPGNRRAFSISGGSSRLTASTGSDSCARPTAPAYPE